ncbi:hypothetical protein EC960109_4993A, partial [Escherichia coli 96.0109]
MRLLSLLSTFLGI